MMTLLISHLASSGVPRSLVMTMLAGLAGCSQLSAPNTPADDGPHLANVFELGREGIELSKEAETLWPGMGLLDSAFLIIDHDTETIVCQERAPGFDELTESPLPDCRAFVRPRIFPRRMQASLGLFGGGETVVVSSPEALEQTDSEWLLLFVHERFHEYQSLSDNYANRVNALNLDQGDQTGMWMLAYPFPYQDEATGRHVTAWRDAILAALDDPTPSRQSILPVLAARSATLERVGPDAARYAEFQLWKEGVARWTETAMANALAGSSHPRAAALRETARGVRTQLMTELATLELSTSGRGAFYVLGAAEAILLERNDPTWRERYVDGPLALGPLLERAAEQIRR